MSRRILITGASDGLGRALALALAQLQTDLILTGRRRDALAEVASAARSKGASIQTHLLELSSVEAVSAFGRIIASQSATLDVLIHNAAVVKLGAMEESPIADLDWHIGPNLRSPVILTQQLLPQLRRAHGQIVFINSAAGLVARKGAAFYAATKHALKAIADSLREEVAVDGVTVLSAFPSRMNTPMQDRILAFEGASGQRDRFLDPDAVAQVVVEAMARCERGEIYNVAVRIAEQARFW